MKSLETILISVLALLLVVGVYTVWYGLGVLVLVWCWNTLIASLFGLPTISFLQGVALAIVLSIIRNLLALRKVTS